MKYILLTLIAFPILASAQDSTLADCKLIKETDPYTKETKFSSGFMSLQMGATLSIFADSREIDFFFTIPEECYNDQSTISIFFEGSKVKTSFRNTGSMNCEGNFHFIFRNGELTPTVLKKLSTQKVSSFVFTGSDAKRKPVTVSLLPDQQAALMTASGCIANESKALIKK